MQELIEDLLALSKLEQEDLELQYEQFDAVKMVNDAVFTLQHKAKQKNLTLTLQTDNKIMLEADKPRVKQIIINLVDNAINYTPAKGTITVSVNQHDQYICFTVADTGIGIDEESLSRIFERFYRVDKARSRNTGGTGLGLAIVKHIVEVHNGKIEIESEVNKGTTINVYLPVTKDLE